MLRASQKHVIACTILPPEHGPIYPAELPAFEVSSLSYMTPRSTTSEHAILHT